MSEEWRPIPEFPHHEASSLGRVRRTTNGKGRAAPGLILKQKARPSGYVVVSISGTKHFVHRLVCAAFHGAPAAGAEASHESGVKSDNQPSNLRWRSRQSNEAMKELHGTRLKGESCHAAKLDPLKVFIIRCGARLGMGTHEQFAALFNVSRAAISDVINYRTWKHVA